jgi:two-component system cell cycle response regulator DivK
MTRSSAARKVRHDDEAPVGQPRPQEPQRNGAGLVLLADDSVHAREMYGTYLQFRGFAFQPAHDGIEAIDLAIALQPDVIVMDMAMPILDGVSAIERLRRHERTRTIPIILLTGYPQRAIERGASQAGADVFLAKPCLPQELETHVRRLLESKHR